jgi:hypothetical protein
MSVEGSVSRNVKNNSQHDAIPAGANVADDRAPAWGAPGPNRRDRQPAKRGLGVGWSLPPRPLASGSAFTCRTWWRMAPEQISGDSDRRGQRGRRCPRRRRMPAKVGC